MISTNIRRSRSCPEADLLMLSNRHQNPSQDVPPIRQEDLVYVQLVRRLERLFLAAIEVVVADVEDAVDGSEDCELPVSIQVDAGWLVQSSMSHDCVAEIG